MFFRSEKKDNFYGSRPRRRYDNPYQTPRPHRSRRERLQSQGYGTDADLQAETPCSQVQSLFGSPSPFQPQSQSRPRPPVHSLETVDLSETQDTKLNTNVDLVIVDVARQYPDPQSLTRAITSSKDRISALESKKLELNRRLNVKNKELNTFKQALDNLVSAVDREVSTNCVKKVVDPKPILNQSKDQGEKIMTAARALATVPMAFEELEEKVKANQQELVKARLLLNVLETAQSDPDLYNKEKNKKRQKRGAGYSEEDDSRLARQKRIKLEDHIEIE